jgi:ribonuclease P protein component
MISRKHRFHGYGSLKQVYQNGRTVRGPLFAVKSLPNSKRDGYRLAVVVSRKINKSAVARNRIRRRLYEAVREMEGDIINPHDIVITVFHDTVLEATPDKLRDQLKKQLSVAGVLAKRVR